MTVLLVGSVGIAGGLMGRSGGPVVVLAALLLAVQLVAAVASGASWGTALVGIVLSQWVLQGAYLATVAARTSRRAAREAAAL